MNIEQIFLNKFEGDFETNIFCIQFSFFIRLKEPLNTILTYKVFFFISRKETSLTIKY